MNSSVISSLRNQFIQEIKKPPGILESEPVISEHLRLRHKFIMLSLHLLLLTTGVQCMTPLEEQLSYELNRDGYIECYEDLDCPDPVEDMENKTISSFSCSGEIKSQLCLHRLCSGDIIHVVNDNFFMDKCH